MDRDAQARLRTLLARTLDDARLSKSEAQTLEATVEGIVHDASALAFARNEAFRLAREQIEDAPGAVLGWLDRVDKVIDRARGAGGARVEERVAFSPGQACLRLLTGTLQAARRSVDVCVFTITDDRLSDLLLALHARGVRLRVVTDDEKTQDPGSDVGRLAKHGIEVRTDRAPDHMHHKFAIVDGRELVNGSYNWTRSAVGNWENLHATTSPAVVGAFQRQFEALWASLASGP
jgi:phosphatidylserine/phosphatidylglycerophosphate/cardiolipin synthase-like enzyme